MTCGALAKSEPRAYATHGHGKCVLLLTRVAGRTEDRVVGARRVEIAAAPGTVRAPAVAVAAQRRVRRDVPSAGDARGGCGVARVRQRERRQARRGEKHQTRPALRISMTTRFDKKKV